MQIYTSEVEMLRAQCREWEKVCNSHLRLIKKLKKERAWVGLTDEEIIDVIHPLVMADMADEATDYEIARAIEAKLKEKNT